MSRAKSGFKTIVMPESEDLRILEAASITLARGTANIVLLGERDEVIANAKAHGFDVSGAKIISMNDPQLIESYAAKFAELRAKKGVTLDQARETMKDGAYFGTMMVYMGAADGLVSGANHTTANTIRPALQFIKTKPGTKTVSGAFLMSLADRVLLFADCAVTIDPTPEQLADIAIASNETAKMFGIDPRIALLSYSTGTSGKSTRLTPCARATNSPPSATRRPSWPARSSSTPPSTRSSARRRCPRTRWPATPPCSCSPT